MPAIGYVTQDENGSFKGHLRTLSIHAEIAIVENDKRSNDTQPHYRVLSGDVEIGAGWNRRAESSDRAGSTPTSAGPRAKTTAGSPSSGTRPIEPIRPALSGAGL